MSYSVNFSENVSGKIVLDNVVMNGAKYAPSVVTEVFTKDAAGNLTKQHGIDLAKIIYSVAPVAPTVTPVAPVAPTPTVTPVAPTVTLTPTVDAAEAALANAQTVISVAITKAREYKDIKFPAMSTTGGSTVPTVDPAIAAVDAAIAAVDPTIATKYTATKTQLEAINKALSDLNVVLNAFNTSTTTLPTEDELKAAIDKVKDEHNKLFTSSTIKGGAPLRFGSPSSKTKRNRRRNRRFAKKSYKRRH